MISGSSSSGPGHAARATRRRFLRAPIVHFVAIGGCLFALGPWRWSRNLPGGRERPPVVLTAADVCRLSREWSQQYGSPPSTAEVRLLVGDAIDEEVLHREALALGFHHADPVVRARLVKLGRSLGLGAEGDGEAIEGEARALGLDRTDALVRRHLADMMRLAAAKLKPSDLPAEAELREYYEQHNDRFLDAARTRLTHVYLSLEHRGGAAREEARQLLGRLQRDGVDPQDAPALGDPFLRGPHVPGASRSELERIFGSEFAAAIDRVPSHAWAGPMRSSYGLHLVWVHERVPAHARPFGSVRNQVLHAVLGERRAERLRTRMEAFRSRYRIEIPPLDASDALPSRMCFSAAGHTS